MYAKNMDFNNQTIVLGGKFKLKEHIGKGSFGQVFKAFAKGTDTPVAVKIEKTKLNLNMSLSKEAGILSKMNGKLGFPSLFGYGTDQTCNYMATTLLGPDLENRLKACGGKFSLKTTLMLADQILTRVETLHEQGYLHRDIKPQNLLMGLGSTEKNVFLIDFGLSMAYIDSQGQHIKFRDRSGFIGTARYASANAHMGCELSRRDDLESIGYMLVYFLKGKLPWQNLRGVTKKEKYTMISHLKNSISPETLCKGLPKEFATYFTQVKSLGFVDVPSYKGLRKLFRTLLIEKGFDCDYHYGWLKKKPVVDSDDPYLKMEAEYSECPTNIRSLATAQPKTRKLQLLEEEKGLSKSHKEERPNLLKRPTSRSEVDPKFSYDNENISDSTNKSIVSGAENDPNTREQENPTFLNLNTRPFNNLLRQTTTASKDESTKPGGLLGSFKDENSAGKEQKKRGFFRKTIVKYCSKLQCGQQKTLFGPSKDI